MSNPVSFKITRDPQQAQGSTSSSKTSRPRSHHSHHHHHSGRHRHSRYASDTESGSDDDDDGSAFNRRDKGKGRAEAITSIDKNGIRSVNEAPKAKALVIPSQPNKDFRKAALELRAAKKGLSFLPGGPVNGGSTNGEVIDKNGRKRELTQEELAFLKSGTNVQRIGTGVVTGGIRERAPAVDRSADTPVPEDNSTVEGVTANDAAQQTATASEGTINEEISEDARALRELLASNSDEPTGPKVHIIPQQVDDAAVSEQDAYAHDIASRPDSATLEDYERVPIEDFGAALLRGMGGGNKPRKVTQAYVPKPRTALLGIGAKSREETFGKDFVLASNNGKKETKRDGMKFVPLARIERPSSSGSASPAPLPPSIEDSKSSSSRSRSDRYKDEDRYSSSGSRKRREDDYYDDRDAYKKSKKRREEGSDDDSSRRHRRRERSRSRSPGRSTSSAKKEKDRSDRDEKDRRHRERSRSRERSSYKDKERSSSDRRDRYR